MPLWFAPFLAGGKLAVTLKFLSYRLASWTGSAYFYRRARRTGRRRYYAAAGAVFVLSWLLIVFGAAELSAWLWKILQRSYP